MRNLIGLAVALALLSIPGCSRVYGGPGVSVTFSAGYADYWDDDMDWDNVIMIDNTRIGIWVMLPSGRWVLRCRSIWWDSGYDEWCFGPWWYDYSISYGCHYSYPFYGVGFHTYMHRHYPRWHNHYFNHRGGHYVRRMDRHPVYRDNHAGHNAPVIRHEAPRASAQAVRPEPQRDNGPVIQRQRQRDNAPVMRNEPPRDNNSVVQPQRQTERTTVITRERTITRTDGGDRIQRTNNITPSHQTEITRSRTTTRDNSMRSGHSVTRTDTRSREIRRR
jgi:hypothetical protein